MEERRRAEDDRGHQRHLIRLEQVGRHPRAVPHVVPDVVGDDRGVARVVLRDVLLDLPHQVRPHIGRLGEDASSHSHEHRDQRGAEREPFQHGGRVPPVVQDDPGGAHEPQTHGEHPGDAAGPERQRERPAIPRLPGCVGHPDVAADGEPHAGEPGHAREHRAEHEGEGAAELDDEVRVRGPVGGQHEEQQDGQERAEGTDGPELPPEVGAAPLLDGLRDLAHLLRSLGGSQDPAAEDHRHPERGQGHRSDDPQEGDVEAGEGNLQRLGLHLVHGTLPIVIAAADGRARCLRGDDGL